jgi:hypothetical protein
VTQARRAALAALPVLIVPALLGACSTEIDPSATTVPPDRTTTTVPFVAEGTTAELLDQLLTEATALSERIVENEGDEALLDRINTIWDAARPGVDEAAPELILEFDRAMVMMNSAVDRRRHADADKALNNLRNLIAALPPLD